MSRAQDADQASLERMASSAEETALEMNDRLALATSHAVLMQMIYISYRLNLLPAMRILGPSTLSEIAQATELKARYLLELLNSLTCHNIIDLEDTRYSVPQKTVDILITPGPKSFLGLPIMLNTMSKTIPGVLDSFPQRSGRKGVTFSEFGEEAIEALDLMNEPGIPTNLLPQLTTCGMADFLSTAQTCADIGCGSGAAVLFMASNFPHVQFYGFDISSGSIDVANGRLANSGLTNVQFEVCGMDDMRGSFDAITTFDVVHDIPHSQEALVKIHEMLKPGGAYLMVEPRAETEVAGNMGNRGGFLYGISLLHCLTQNLAHDGEGLGACWGSQRQREYLIRAGFGSDAIKLVQFEYVQSASFWMCRK